MNHSLGIHHFWLFMITGILLNVTPGQDTFYILGRTLAQGRRAGIASVLGISAGSFVHTLAAATGISVLLATSAYSFMIVKWVGGAYLIYLGLRMAFSHDRPTVITRNHDDLAPLAIFRQGLMTNLLNPKVALFFLSFVPQFIAPDSPARFLAFLILGACFIATGTLWCFALVGLASQIGDRLRRNTALAGWLNRMAGAVFVYLGARLALTPSLSHTP